MFLYVLEAAIATFALWFLLFQVIIPIIKGNVLLPFFRRKSKIINKIIEQEEKIEEIKLEQKLETLKHKTEKE